MARSVGLSKRRFVLRAAALTRLLTLHHLAELRRVPRAQEAEHAPRLAPHRILVLRLHRREQRRHELLVACVRRDGVSRNLPERAQRDLARDCRVLVAEDSDDEREERDLVRAHEVARGLGQRADGRERVGGDLRVAGVTADERQQRIQDGPRVEAEHFGRGGEEVALV